MKKFGLLGEKLGHSYSKEIHELLFKRENIEAKYELIEKNIENLPEVLESIREGKYNGINVTIPYKVEIMQYLDEISDIAKKIGAVNTVTCKNGKLIGENTDYFGFLKTLKMNEIEIEDAKVLILGTGGAAKAIYNVLVDEGSSKIFLATLSQNKKLSLRQQDRTIHYGEIKNLRDVDIIVNCTPLGMFPVIDNCPLNESNLIDCKYLIDIIYNPKETLLIKKYKAKGTKTINGLTMLIVQAIKSEEIWNEKKFNKENFNYIYEEISKKLYK